MTDLQTLIQAVDELNADELKQLYSYILETRVRFLDTQPTEQVEATSPRILGLHAHLGAAWLSDDFFDELPDSFWMGEE